MQAAQLNGGVDLVTVRWIGDLVFVSIGQAAARHDVPICRVRRRDPVRPRSDVAALRAAEGDRIRRDTSHQRPLMCIAR
jgi:hypothetical protein